jgi:glutamine amidotransferase|tara:strand:- start:5909 stop:6577 length:669 start_codon:yes stop_codon:yes gene_type:complete
MQNSLIKNRKKVVIIDYQLGNLYSVKQACDVTGMNAVVSSVKKDILAADALILPGVGAFIQAMNNLKKLDIIDAIKSKVTSGTPLFGICLGLQLLFTKSEEFGSGEGLNLISGVIKKFPEEYGGKKIKVPHITWNQLIEVNTPFEETPFKDLNNLEFMYFIHSYYVEPTNDSLILTNTNYDGIEFCSSVIQNNIFATQFHPEKSANKGISIYENWAKINGLI